MGVSLTSPSRQKFHQVWRTIIWSWDHTNKSYSILARSYTCWKISFRNCSEFLLIQLCLSCSHHEQVQCNRLWHCTSKHVVATSKLVGFGFLLRMWDKTSCDTDDRTSRRIDHNKSKKHDLHPMRRSRCSGSFIQPSSFLCWILVYNNTEDDRLESHS